MALIVAGERSGAGKTTVTLALLAYLCRLHNSSLARPSRVQSFKVGPDYIDPMFHRYVTGRPCRNLDPILTSDTYVQQCFASHDKGAAFSLIEGVMGLFDGVAGDTDAGSTAHIARLLKVPVLLVLDCSRLSRSVGAIAHGFKTFDSSVQLAGLVLNRVGSDRHLSMLRDALRPVGLPILGVIHREDAIALPDRHLGLVPTDELPELDGVVEQLAQLGNACFDWETLLPLLASSDSQKLDLSGGTESLQQASGFPSPPWEAEWGHASDRPTLKIAVARDCAFNFYYADNLDSLARLGAKVVEWSPLTDTALPPGIAGMYVGGGFPEMFAAALSANEAMRQAVRRAIAQGMPTYAECGGLMYLCKHLVDFEGTAWPMVGAIPTTVRMGKRLTLGYRRAIAQQDSPLVPKGKVVWGHEFHRSILDHSPSTPLYEVRGYAPYSPIKMEGWSDPNLHASYVHLHWGDRPDLPARFITHCQRWASSNLDGIWAERLSNGPTPVENE